ncbi:MAG TPA: proprotein convertase P-domain-containing protein [Thermoanaerobaculia bacterium]|nr:proprotein convertase P-domain-containing protein [Thermoanaerobaculia bacterium]
MHIRFQAGADAADAIPRFVRANADLFLSNDSEADIRLDRVRESIAGKHYHFQQFIDGIEVIGGELVASAGTDGAVVEIHNRLANRAVAQRLLDGDAAVNRLERLLPEARAWVLGDRRAVVYNLDGTARPAWRIVAEHRRLEPWAYVIDAESGSLLAAEPLFHTARGRVFEVNPVAKLNDPNLRDQNGAASAVPDAAYSIVDLPDLPQSGPLAGPNVSITDLEPPTNVPADAAQSLLFDRSQPQFQEVNAYYHLDRIQRYLQSLGYTGARRIVGYSIPVDPHAANGTDNSYYISGLIAGQGALYFGDGGTADAEDPDIMLHEYGHAIQDWIAPGSFGGTPSSQAQALGEGFGDYWSFSSNYIGTIPSGRDPYCIADWDARCAGDDPSKNCGYPAGADCLRRVDGTKTMNDYIVSDTFGTQHQNGEIWSSALREIFINLVHQNGVEQGRRLADTLILEAHFGTPPRPAFADMARRILDAASLLGIDRAPICSAMTLRLILGPGDCDRSPRGELTWIQGFDQAVAIPDNTPSGIVAHTIVTDTRTIDKLYVQVDIAHTARGDLNISLTGPDGTTVVLQQSAFERTPNIFVTYGIDAVPAESLDAFHGKPANGEWKLSVADVLPKDTGSLISWSLVIKYTGDEPLTTRPLSTGPRRLIAAAGHVPGANGTLFVTDLRLFNRGDSAASVMATFTPSGTDGTTQFSAVQLSLAPHQVVALDDVVNATFHTVGLGTIELQGGGDNLVATSRTYNQAPGRTFGQFVPSSDTNDATGSNTLYVSQLQSTAAFRSNLGVAEVSGSSGTVRVSLFDAAHHALATNDYTILPWGHFQVSLLGDASVPNVPAMRAEVAVVAGAARIVAYGSVIDNGSGDPIYIPARLAPPETNAVIAGVIHAPGALGTQWRSDLWLTQTGNFSARVLATLTPPDGSSTRSQAIAVGSGETVRIDDILATGFPAATSGELALALPDGVLATSRTWTTGDGGSFGQFIPSIPASAAAGLGRSVDTIEIASSTSFRTNAGFAEVSGAPAIVRITLSDAAGRELAHQDYGVAAFGQVQVPLASIYSGIVTNGRLSFAVTGGAGRILAYASVIDNGSGDPIYVPAE